MRANWFVEIEDDLFDIASRLREIDPDYFVVYNLKKSRYEVHHRGQGADSLCLALPFEELDARTIFKVRKTRMERLDEQLREIERHNAIVEAQNVKRQAELLTAAVD